MATDQDPDWSRIPGKKGQRRREKVFQLNDQEVHPLQNEISMEIVTLVRTRLQKAQMEGRIPAEISDRLLHRYITDLKQMEHGTTRQQLQERLRTLEKRQEELVHAYYDSLRQLQTEIQRYQNVSTSNEVALQGNEKPISRTPGTMSEPEPARFNQNTQRPKRTRDRSLQHSVFPYLRKFVLSSVIISTLTIVGISFGMATFMATGSFMILGTLLFRLYKK